MIVSSIKPRLFVDMDGTLAEWRNIHIDVEDYETSLDIQKKLQSILNKPGYYRSLSPHKEVVQAIKEIISSGWAEVFILSCVLLSDRPGCPAEQKKCWLDEYLPEIRQDHQIFVPDGENKRLFAEEFLKCHGYKPLGAGDFLFDDYTKNLQEWENIEIGTKGIKLLNNVNSSKGTWQGVQVAYDSADLYGAMKKIVLYGEAVREDNPEKYEGSLVGNETDFEGMIER